MDKYGTKKGKNKFSQHKINVKIKESPNFISTIDSSLFKFIDDKC